MNMNMNMNMNMTSLSTGVESKPRRHNGKRSFEIVPATIIAWSGGRAPISETEALLALGWIFRRLSQWKTKLNVFDLMCVGSGRGSREFPAITLEGDLVANQLRSLLARLAVPDEHREFARFARQMLGFRSLMAPLRVPARKPASPVFTWLSTLFGCRLKKSPNQYHPKAVWLRGAILRLSPTGTRWQLRVRYSYRHDDGWAIGLDQLPGEKLEDFDARAWTWIRDQIAWRHDEQFYHRFFAPADGMKKSELRSCGETERKMHAMTIGLRTIFAWGCNAPGFWENEIAESLVCDASEQFRELKKIDMTGARLRTLKRWIREDRRAEQARRAEKQAA